MSRTAINALKAPRANNKASQLKSTAFREAATIFILAIGLPVLSAGCALFIDKEVMFLRAAEGHATQQDVQDRLGTPLWSVRQQDGETVWVYQMTQREKGGNNISTSRVSGATNMSWPSIEEEFFSIGATNPKNTGTRPRHVTAWRMASWPPVLSSKDHDTIDSTTILASQRRCT